LAYFPIWNRYQGYEDRATHLVVGEERRTLKVLLAVANGAHLVTPEWLTASLEAVRKPSLCFQFCACLGRLQSVRSTVGNVVFVPKKSHHQPLD
jgi:hypothetical protein